MVPVKYWEDYNLGDKMITRGLTVTETHLVNWAGLTLDFYDIHTDEEFASQTAMKKRVAHGPLIFGLSVGLVSQIETANRSVIAWLGSEVRMTAPVFIGDTITVEYTVVEKKETKKPTQGIQTWLYQVFNQRHELVMENRMKFMMYRRVEDAQ